MLSSQDWAEDKEPNYNSVDIVDSVDGQYDQSAGYDDYYDDGYGDEYEDGYDEEYDDAGDYDDGDDYYYQRQLDRVMDELSDLKRTIKSNKDNTNVPNQVHFAPDHITWPPQANMGRVAPYNHYSLYGNSMMSQDQPDNALKAELNQLKEQLSKIREDIGVSKHEQRLKAEIDKLKDDFSKERLADQRASENRREMLSEMAKLNSNTELEKMRSTFELEKIRSNTELEKIRSNAELEKIKLNAELDKTKADTEMLRLGNGLDLNNKINVDNSFKKEIDRLESQLEYVKGDKNNGIASNMYAAEIARLNAQVLALQNANIAATTVVPSVVPVSSAVAPVIAKTTVPIVTAETDVKDFVKEEIARLSAQINKIAEKQESEKYFNTEFDRVDKRFDNLADRYAAKDMKSFQAQFNNTILHELRQLADKVEALPKNELSPQEDSLYDYLEGGQQYDFATSLEGAKPEQESGDTQSIELPLNYIHAVAKKARRRNQSHITVNIPKAQPSEQDKADEAAKTQAFEAITQQLASIQSKIDQEQQAKIAEQERIEQENKVKAEEAEKVKIFDTINQQFANLQQQLDLEQGAKIEQHKLVVQEHKAKTEEQKLKAYEDIKQRLDTISLELQGVLQQSSTDIRADVSNLVNDVSQLSSSITSNVDNALNTIVHDVASIGNRVSHIIDKTEAADSASFALTTELVGVKDRFSDLQDYVYAVSTKINDADSKVSKIVDVVNGIESRLQELGKSSVQSMSIVEDGFAQLLSRINLREGNEHLVDDIAFIRNKLSELQTRTVLNQETELSQEDRQAIAKLQQELKYVKQAVQDISTFPELIGDYFKQGNVQMLGQELSILSSDIASIRTQLEKISTTVVTEPVDYTGNDMLVSELNSISNRMDTELSNVSSQLLSLSANVQSDVQYIRRQIEVNSGDDVPFDNSLDVVMQELTAIKNQLAQPQEDAILSQVSQVLDSIKDARLLDQTEIAQELEGLRSDITEALLNNNENEFDDINLKTDIEKLLKSVEDVSKQVVDIKAELANLNKASTEDVSLYSANNLEIQQVVDEVASLKRDIKALTSQIKSIVDTSDSNDTVDSVIVEELVSLRNVVEQVSVDMTKAVSEQLETRLDDVSELLDEQLQEFRNAVTQACVDDGQKVNQLLGDISDSVTDLAITMETTMQSSVVTDTLDSIQQAIRANTVHASSSVTDINQQLSSLRQLVEQVGLDSTISSGAVGSSIKQELQSIQQLLQQNQIDDRTNSVVDIVELHNGLTTTITQALNNAVQQSESQYSMLQQSQVGVLSALDSIALQLEQNVNNTELMTQLNLLRQDLQSLNQHDVDNNRQVLSSIHELGVQLGRLKVAQESIDDYDNAVDNIVIEELVSLRSMIGNLEQSKEVNLDVSSVTDAINDLKQELLAIKSDSGINSALDVIMLQNDIIELKTLTDISVDKLQESQNIILDQVKSIGTQDVAKLTDALRQELNVLREDFNQVLASNNETDDAVDNLLLEELVALKSTIQDINTTPVALDTNALQSALSTIKSEIVELSRNQYSADSLLSPDVLQSHLRILKDELMQGLGTRDLDASALNAIRSDIDNLNSKLDIVATKNTSSEAYIQGLADIKKTLSQVKDTTSRLVSDNEFINEFAEQFELLQKELFEVKKAKEEPDYSVLNEIMQVRNEFDTVKNQLSVIQDNAHDSNKLQEDAQNILQELATIKRDLFNVSMANVGDNGVDEFENYNQILFDEITSLKDQIKELKTINTALNQDDEFKTIDDVLVEIDAIKESITTNSELLLTNDNDIDNKLDRLRDELVNIIKANKDTNTTPEDKEETSY
jgi:DNA repair exonuclease SbcCD ATPase subunit